MYTYACAFNYQRQKAQHGMIFENNGFFYLLPEAVAGGAIICNTFIPISDGVD